MNSLKINNLSVERSYKKAAVSFQYGDGLSQSMDNKNDGTTVCSGVVAMNANATYIISTNYNYIKLYSDGNNWFLI